MANSGAELGKRVRQDVVGVGFSNTWHKSQMLFWRLFEKGSWSRPVCPARSPRNSLLELVNIEV